MGNREALLEAGLACIEDRGYAQTTARDIAGRAGVSLGAIGYHFGSTDALLHEALAEAVRRWLTPLIGLISTLPALIGQGQFGPGIDRLLETFAGNRPLVIAYFDALSRAEHSPVLRESMASDFDSLRLAISAGITALQGEQPPAQRLDSDVCATLVMAVFDGLIIQWLLAPDRLPSGSAIAATLQHALLQARVSRPPSDAPWGPGQ